MSEWKPCPFCGSVQIVSCDDDGLFWKRCKNCGATGPETSKYDGEEGDPFTDWNARAGITSRSAGVNARAAAEEAAGEIVEEFERLWVSGRGLIGGYHDWLFEKLSILTTAGVNARAAAEAALEIDNDPELAPSLIPSLARQRKIAYIITKRCGAASVPGGSSEAEAMRQLCVKKVQAMLKEYESGETQAGLSADANEPDMAYWEGKTTAAVEIITALQSVQLATEEKSDAE